MSTKKPQSAVKLEETQSPSPAAKPAGAGRLGLGPEAVIICAGFIAEATAAGEIDSSVLDKLISRLQRLRLTRVRLATTDYGLTQLTPKMKDRMVWYNGKRYIFVSKNGGNTGDQIKIRDPITGVEHHPSIDKLEVDVDDIPADLRELLANVAKNLMGDFNKAM